MYCRSKPISPAAVVYNPASFDPEVVLPAHLRKFAAYARWFVHTIYTHRIFDRRGEADYVPLHAAHLRRVLPQDYYRDIIAALIEGGVVETDGYWIRGEKSKGFRLAGDFQQEVHARHVVEHPMLAKKLRAGRERRAAEITLDVHKHLWRHIRELEIDLDGVNTNQPRLAVPADCVRDGQWFMRVCEYGRVHTPLTNMPRELRQHLRYRGEPLVNIDVRNSQPLLLSILLVNYYSSGGTLSSINGFHLDKQREGLYLQFPAEKWVQPGFNSVSTTIKSPSPHTPLRCVNVSPLSVLVPDLPEDVLRYIGLTEAGDLYEHLMYEAGVPFSRRDEFKRDFFGRVLFCKSHERYDEGKLFAKLFPSVTKALMDLKRKDYTFPATMLQRIESSLIINRVVRRIMESHTDEFIATIHDSVLCAPGNAEAVQAVVRREYARVGLYPTLNVEHYGRETNARVA